MIVRSSWLRALLLGVLIGPTPFAPDAPERTELADAEPLGSERTAPDPAFGHAVRGLNFYVWEEHREEASGWAADLLLAGGLGADSAHWRAVAAARAAGPPVLTDDSEAELGAWAEAAGAAHSAPLGPLLCLLPCIDRTRLVASWATSPSERVRGALADALSTPFEAVGVRGALEHLQEDPSADVRRLARLAAATRRVESSVS